MGSSLRVLMIETKPEEALGYSQELIRGGFEVDYRVVKDEASLRHASSKANWDVALCAANARNGRVREILETLKIGPVPIPLVLIYENAGAEQIAHWLSMDILELAPKWDLSQLTSAVRRLVENEAVETLLLDPKTLYHVLLDAKSFWICVLDRNLDILLWNRGAEEITGYDARLMVGNPEAFDHIFPDAEYRNFVKTRTRLGLQNGEPFADYETRVRCKNGQDKFILWNNRHIRDQKGAVVGILAVGQDMTERKWAEEMLRDTLRTSADIVKAIPSGLLIYKHQKPDKLVLMSANPEAERLLKRVLKDAQGKEYDQLWPNASLRGEKRLVLEVARTQTPYHSECVFIREEGFEGFFRFRAFPLQDSRIGVAIETLDSGRKVADLVDKSMLGMEVERRVLERTAEISEENIRLRAELEEAQKNLSELKKRMADLSKLTIEKKEQS